MQSQRAAELLESFAADPTREGPFRAIERSLLQAGDYGRLASVYECRLSALAPGSPARVELLLGLGGLLEERLGDLRGARRRYQEASREAPRDPAPLRRLRLVHARAGDLAAALQVAEIEMALAHAPAERARLLAESARLWRDLGDPAEAKRCLERALDHDRGCGPALEACAELEEAAGRSERACELLERLAGTLEGAARARTLERMASIMLGDDPERALALLREAVRADPSRAGALKQLLPLEEERGHCSRVDEICEALWGSADGAKERLELALRAGQSHLESGGQAERALEWADRAIEIVPRDPAVHLLRARALERLGRAAERIRALEELASLGPARPGLALEIAALHEKLSSPSEAALWLRKHLEQEPEDAAALAALDRCAAATGNPSERVQILERRAVLARSPAERARLLGRLGDLWADTLGNPGRAESAYRRALAEDPECEGAIEALERLLGPERALDLAAIVEELARGRAPAPARARWWTRLGRIRLELLDDAGGAVDAFRQALALRPSEARALVGLREVARLRDDPVLRLEACELELGLQREGPSQVRLLEEAVEAAMAAGDPDRARKLASLWAEREPGAEALRAIASAAREGGEHEQERRALVSLESLLAKQAPERLECLLRLADLELARPSAEAARLAATWLEEALSARGDCEIRRKLVTLYERAGRFADVGRLLREAAQNAPPEEAGSTRLELARALERSGDRHGAASALGEAWELAPETPGLADALEPVLVELGRFEELARILRERLARTESGDGRRSIAARAAHVLLDELQRPADAVAILRETVDAARSGPPENLYSRALEQLGDSKALEDWLERRAQAGEGSERLDALLRLARLRREDSRIEEAASTLWRAWSVATASSRPELRRLFAAWLEEDLGPHDRHDLLSRLLSEERDPAGRLELRVARATVLAELGREPEACEELERARTEGPLQGGGLALLARLYESLGRVPERALVIRELIRATDRPEEIRDLRLELASLLGFGPESVRDRHEAEALLRGLARANPADPEPFLQLVRLLEETSQHAALTELLRERLSRPGLDPEQWRSLALRLAQMQAAPEAAAWLRTIREKLGPHPAVDRALADALSASGEALEEADLAARCGLAAAPRTIARREWLTRFVSALERAALPLAERIRRVVSVLEGARDDPVLVRARLDLLRDAGDPSPLADALEEALSRPGLLEGSHRQRAVRDLIVLAEGPLGDAARAVRWLEHELPSDPSLSALASRVAARVAEPELKLKALSSLVLRELPGVEPKPEQVKEVALALWRTGRASEAARLLRVAVEREPRDPDLLRACESLARKRGDPVERLAWLERLYVVEPTASLEIAQTGAELAESAGDAQAALRWLRRWELLQPLPRPLAARWLELEGSLGSSGAQLSAIRAVRRRAESPRARQLLAIREAAVLERVGERDLARRVLREASEEARQPEPELLKAWERLLRDSLQPDERAAVLELLSKASGLPEQERTAYLVERAKLLAASVGGQAAIAELRELFDGESGSWPERRRALGRELLRLYRSRGLTREWCEVAEMLLPLLRPEDALRLRREIARELGGPLASTEKAILVWSEILEGDPRDEEALRALADLLGGPGTEARRAAALEQLAAVAVSDAPQLLLEAAGIWWTLLGDAERALRAVERALALDAGRGEAHALRVEICAALGRADPAAASLARLIEGEPAGLSARAWIRLAQALSLLPELHAGASRAAARAVALSKPGEDVRRETQVVLEQVSDWDRLVELLQEEAGAAPLEKARALVQRLARVEWLERHDPARACTAFEALGSFGALDPEDRELYAKALAAQGRWAESLELRRSLLEEQGEAAAAEAWLELASCYLERLDDPRRAAVATDSALARDPTCTEALRLRADLDGALGDAQAEASRREALAERLRDPPAAAHELARAAALAREPLADPQRARRLFLRALDTDPACLAACMGAGELAFEAGEWESAAVYLGKALDSLPGSPLEGRRGELARIAAQAAAELGRPAETLALLELALGASPNDPRTLDAGANACLRIEAWQRATDLLKARLAVDGLEGAERAERLVRLGRAAEALGDRATAADALEEALGLTPGDEALRARITQILEDVGDRARLLKHLDDRAPLAPSERGRLLRRAAQIAMELGDRAGARARLEKVVAEHPADSESWHDLVSLVLEDEGPEAALERAAQGLDALGASPGRARLLGLRARVLDSLGRATEAAEAALAALESNPKDQDVARCLAVHSGRTGEWKRTARALERALDLSRFEPALEAQIWDAVGRLYAGPLADLERAERAYRRALASNPEHDRAREALADVTSFDPSRHAESLTLHLALLAKFPARRASWVALERIASHWRRLDARGTCRSILAALANERAAEIGREAGSLLINLRPEKAVEAAIEGARKEAPRGGAREAAAALGAELPVVLRAPLDDLGGPLLSLPDEALCGLLQKAASRLEESSERRVRRRTSVRARRAEPPDALGCRAELLGVAAARTVGAGAMGLREAIESLVTAWPSTSELKLERGADLAEVSQICPPVRVLLLRAAHAVAERLGLGIRAEKE